MSVCYICFPNRSGIFSYFLTLTKILVLEPILILLFINKFLNLLITLVLDNWFSLIVIHINVKNHIINLNSPLYTLKELKRIENIYSKIFFLNCMKNYANSNLPLPPWSPGRPVWPGGPCGPLSPFSPSMPGWPLFPGRPSRPSPPSVPFSPLGPG